MVCGRAARVGHRQAGDAGEPLGIGADRGAVGAALGVPDRGAEKDLEAHRRKVLETRGAMALKTDKGVRIDYLQGFGQFVDAHTLAINTTTNQDDPHTRASLPVDKASKTISFGAAVIATGAPPFIPPIPGAGEGLESGGVLTSDTVWALAVPPKKLAVVGAGAIGVEIAQIFQDFGARVTLLEAQERILAEVEPEIAQALAGILDDEPRLDVHTGAAVSKISGKPGAMKIAYTDSDAKKHSLTVDYVIMATGKRPVLDGLNLEAAGVAADRSIIKADSRCRTGMPHIFAVGDVIGGQARAGQDERCRHALLTRLPLDPFPDRAGWHRVGRLAQAAPQPDHQ